MFRWANHHKKSSYHCLCLLNLLSLFTTFCGFRFSTLGVKKHCRDVRYIGGSSLSVYIPRGRLFLIRQTPNTNLFLVKETTKYHLHIISTPVIIMNMWYAKTVRQQHHLHMSSIWEKPVGWEDYADTQLDSLQAPNSRQHFVAFCSRVLNNSMFLQRFNTSCRLGHGVGSSRCRIHSRTSMNASCPCMCPCTCHSSVTWNCNSDTTLPEWGTGGCLALAATFHQMKCSGQSLRTSLDALFSSSCTHVHLRLSTVVLGECVVGRFACQLGINIQQRSKWTHVVL